MIPALVLASLAASFGGMPQATAAQPNAATMLIELIGRQDAKALGREFPVIHGDTGNSFPSYTPGEVLGWLTGCSLEKQAKFGETYLLDYACPARRAHATGCDTGDLRLATGDSDRTLIVLERRKTIADCPPFAPPSPRRTDG